MTSTASSELPKGFVERRVWGGRLWVRKTWEPRLPLSGASLEAAFRAVPGASEFRGRGSVWAAPVGDGERAVLRHYRHGGVLAPLTRDIFVGSPPRPVLELAASEALRRRGVRTPEVLGLFWKPAGPLMYRADLITREVPGPDLAAWLRERHPALRRRRVLRRVGEALAGFHVAGLHHPDLNLKNLIIREQSNDAEVWVLDLDRATVGAPLAEHEAVAQLKRLERSFRKLSRGAPLASEREAMIVLRAYFGPRWRRAHRAHWSLE